MLMSISAVQSHGSLTERQAGDADGEKGNDEVRGRPGNMVGKVGSRRMKMRLFSFSFNIPLMFITYHKHVIMYD